MTKEKASSLALKATLAEERQAKRILQENNDRLGSALAKEQWANGVLQKDNDCLRSTLAEEKWANGVLQKDNDCLRSTLAEEKWANGVLQKDNDCLRIGMVMSLSSVYGGCRFDLVHLIYRLTLMRLCSKGNMILRF